MDVGITVPVLDMDDAEDESSSYSGASSRSGSGGGSDDSFVLAKCFARSDMAGVVVARVASPRLSSGSARE